MPGHKLCRHAIGGIPVLFTVGDRRKNPPEIDQAFESISALQGKGGLLGIRKDQRPGQSPWSREPEVSFVAAAESR